MKKNIKSDINENLISFRNDMSTEKYKEMIALYSNVYLDAKKEIDNLVQSIKNKISNCNPLELLNYMVSMAYMSLINTSSEIQFEADDILVQRSVEYVQSVLVSSESNYSYEDSHLHDESQKYEEILNNVVELQKKIYVFYFLWTAHVLSQDEQIDNDVLQYIIESQLFYNVRGDRYQVYQIDHLRCLIEPHDLIIRKLFNVSSDKFIEGLEKLEYSLSGAKADVFNELGANFDKFGKMFAHDILEDEIEDYFQVFMDEEMQSFINKKVGYSLYDVKAVTGWSDILIDAFSYNINEYDKFYYDGDFSGWPIIDLPIQKKPFINVNGIRYCFDYYSLFDNIYRVLQKTIKELEPTYVNTWSHIQQNTTEIMVEDLMKKILPGCQSYRDNYYPKNTSLKDCAENDILVIYDNVLFIIEVKAGSFVYTPAITDYEAHIKSFKALIEKADYQCDRTLKYIQKHDVAPIYDREKNKKVDIIYSNYSDVYTMCVTVDNFNEFAAKAEKLSFIRMQSDAIALSIDDLRVYSDILNNSLCFLHYMKQRKKAIKFPQIALNDELDHLGLYLNRNMYTMDAEELDNNAQLTAIGFREDIDNYYAGLHNRNLNFDKPAQYIPSRIQEIIYFMIQNNKSDKVAFSTFLLDFDFQGRDEFSDAIERSLSRQREINRMIIISTYGEIRYSLFVYQANIEQIDERERDDYIFASMLMHNEPNRLSINLYYGENSELNDINIRTYSFEEIPEDRKECLKAMGVFIVRSRAEAIKQQQDKGKIGRNDPCPCGSGKKFKKCCINKI